MAMKMKQVLMPCGGCEHLPWRGLLSLHAYARHFAMPAEPGCWLDDRLFLTCCLAHLTPGLEQVLQQVHAVCWLQQTHGEHLLLWKIVWAVYWLQQLTDAHPAQLALCVVHHLPPEWKVVRYLQQRQNDGHWVSCQVCLGLC